MGLGWAPGPRTKMLQLPQTRPHTEHLDPVSEDFGGELEEDFISDTDGFKVSSGLFILKAFLTCSITAMLYPTCPLDRAQRCPDSDET